MEEKNQYISSIEDFLKAKACDKNAVFVFATDVVSKSWSDWTVTGHTNVKSVALSRFLAWDVFKGSFVSAQKEGYSAVPSVLRKMFVYTLIAENAEKQIFKKIINGAEEYRKDAYSFADWISKNLPSLHIWNKRIQENRQSYGELDEEDQDYFLLYNRYSSFLEKNKLFEPAWIDEIDISDTEKHYYIFYPEQLEDFIDYEEVFTKAPNVFFLHLPESTEPPECLEYPDARTELRKTILRIIQLVNAGKADWTEIALTVPDFETYKPYLKKELELYSVPYVLKMGESLTKNCAGRIFVKMLDCHNNEFSYDSVRALLLDETVPWKKEIEQQKKDLIRIGNERRCICPFEEDKDNTGNFEKTDVWNKVLLSLKGIEEKHHPESTKYKDLLDFYRDFKAAVEAFFKKDITFADIKTAWFTFKGSFLESENFSDSEFEVSDKILSRCITELNGIIKVEEDFASQVSIKNPFEFFIKVLDGKLYKMQGQKEGLSVFDYKLSASAAFKYQFVINASQKNLDVQKKRLNFLTQEKRKKLGFFAEDSKMNTSDVTAKLYNRQTESADKSFVHFSYSVDSFSGFAIPHSSLAVIENAVQGTSIEDPIEDYILKERKWFKSPDKELYVTEKQKASLENWQKTALNAEDTYSVNEQLKENAEYALKEYREKVNDITGSPSHIKISARGDLEKFFPCPRKWVLKKLLSFSDDSLDTSLMQNFDMGNLNHKILENFISLYKGKSLPWYDSENDCFMEEDIGQTGVLNTETDVTKKIKEQLYGKLIQEAIKEEFKGIPLVLYTLEHQKEAAADVIFEFLKTLLLPFGEYKGKPQFITFNGIGKCTVFGVEETFAGDFEEYDLFGKIDCLVKTPEGDYIILDYKNSSPSMPSKASATVSDTGILEDFQMALYSNLVKCPETQKKAKGNLFAAYFYAIKSGEKRGLYDETDGTKLENSLQAFEPSMLAVKEYARIFNEKVKAFDFAPHTGTDNKDRLNVNSYENCVSCQFNTVCRTAFTVAERKLPFTGTQEHKNV